MRKIIYAALSLFVAAVVFNGCSGNKPEEGMEDMVEDELVIKNDSMIYGLACDGSSDSAVVLWPFKGDPISFSCIDAKHAGKVMGRPEIGDWVGVMVDPQDSTEATLVINLDEMKGTWTYPVMPVFKDIQHMSKRMQRRFLAQMDDSIKHSFMIPRQYGFVLKRSHQALAVGRIMRNNTLEDDSPVSYPEVKNYKRWYVANGKLLLVSGDFRMPDDKKAKRRPDVVDTLTFEKLQGDSLVLSQNGVTYHFHRQESAAAANAAAQAAADKQNKKKEQMDRTSAEVADTAKKTN